MGTGLEEVHILERIKSLAIAKVTNLYVCLVYYYYISIYFVLS